jgi:TRAP-type C4-dicarboxylate transport system permease small subunit
MSGEPKHPLDDRGEGVISAAIAVLIMAFLGALMWVGFQQMWDTTQQQTNEQISRIGG